MSDRTDNKNVSRRTAALYSIAMACMGLMVGSVIGGTLVQSMYGEMMGMLVGDRSQERYVDALQLLKLMDDGQNEKLKQTLLARVQNDTTLAVTLLEIMPATMRKTLQHYVRFSGTLKSVQADDSELGRAAAQARKNPVVGTDAASPAH